MSSGDASFWDAAAKEAPGYSSTFEVDEESGFLSVCFFLPQKFFSRFQRAELGGFKEGLWQGDCLEVFVFFAPNQSRILYREWNLAASFDWWTCGFKSYRVAAGETDQKQLQSLSPKDLKLNSENRSIEFRLYLGDTKNLKIANIRTCIIDKNIPEPHLLCSDMFAAKSLDFHMV